MNSMKTLSIPIFLIALLCTNSFGQKLSGKILNDKGQPLEFVSVTLFIEKKIAMTAATDSAGQYIFSGVPKNNYTLQAALIGYSTLHKSFNLSSDTIVDIRLIPDSNTLKNVTVFSKKPLIERKIDKLVFNIDGNLNFAGLDAIDILMKAPLLDVRDNSIKRIGGMPMAVMIDGRLLGNLDPATIANKLRSIPSETILRVEIITNPGAEYDAEGVGGLINIVIKKIKKIGYSGSVTAAYTRINSDDLYRLGFDFNYNIKKIRTFFSFGTSTGRALTINDINIFYPAFTWNSKGYRFEYQKPYFTTIGFEYDLSKKSSLGVSVNPLFSNPDQVGGSSIVILNPTNNRIDSTIATTNDSKISYKNYSVNVHYNYALDTTGGQLTIDLDWVKNRFGKDIQNNNETYNSVGSLIQGSKYQYLSDNLDQPELVSLNMVIKRPKVKYMLTYGTKFTFIKSTQLLNQYRINLDPAQIETLTENQFNANQNIQAAFGSYQRTLNKFELKAGLRAEITQLNWDIPNPRSSARKNYFNIFPNLNLGYAINDKNTITFGFNRRFSRPSFSSINPSLIYVNTYRFYQGNSELSPYYTTNLELSYTYKGNLTIGLSHSSTPHSIYGLTSLSSNSNIVVDKFYNYINSQYYSFDCFYSLDKIKKLQSNLEATVYYSKTSSSLPQTASDFNRWSGSFRSSNTYYINNKRTLIGGLIFSYQLADLSGISTTKERYYIDISLKYSLFERKVDITFTGRDIFKTNNFYSSSIVNGILEKSFTNDRSRRFGLTLRYNFGNNKIKKGFQYNAVGGDQSIISK